MTRRLGAWFALAIATMAPAMAADAPPIFVGGAFIRQHAIQDDRGHLLVPVRGVFESLHAGVSYTPPRFVVVRKDGEVVAGLIVGRRSAVIGHEARSLPVAPVRRHGHVYVPLRIIAQLAGASVTYSAKPRLVDIRLPYNELVVGPRRYRSIEAQPESTTPPWAYALAGSAILAFTVELARRLAIAAQRKRAERTSRPKLVALGSRTLQFPYTADSSD